MCSQLLLRGHLIDVAVLDRPKWITTPEIWEPRACSPYGMCIHSLVASAPLRGVSIGDGGRLHALSYVLRLYDRCADRVGACMQKIRLAEPAPPEEC